MKLQKILPSVVVAILCVRGLLPFDVVVAADTSKAESEKAPVTPEVKLVEDYNTWFAGEAFAGDAERLKAGLPRYITDKTVLHEVSSLPWGGTLVGVPGWIEFTRKSSPVFGEISALLDISPPSYYQRGNVVIREVTFTIKASPAAPRDFAMGVMEKFTIERGRIGQIDEFYADTAGLLARLTVLGAIHPHAQ